MLINAVCGKDFGVVVHLINARPVIQEESFLYDAQPTFGKIQAS
jgi:hypothetical protein